MPKTNKDISGIAMGVEGQSRPCKIFDSEVVLTVQEDIDFYKAKMKALEIKNYLLGEFNEDGDYVIAENIRRNLATMPKENTDERFDLIKA